MLVHIFDKNVSPLYENPPNVVLFNIFYSPQKSMITFDVEMAVSMRYTGNHILEIRTRGRWNFHFIFFNVSWCLCYQDLPCNEDYFGNCYMDKYSNIWLLTWCWLVQAALQVQVSFSSFSSPCPQSKLSKNNYIPFRGQQILLGSSTVMEAQRKKRTEE